LHCGFRYLDNGFSTLYFGFSIPDYGFGILEFEFIMPRKQFSELKNKNLTPKSIFRDRNLHNNKILTTYFSNNSQHFYVRCYDSEIVLNMIPLRKLLNIWPDGQHEALGINQITVNSLKQCQNTFKSNLLKIP